MTDEVTRLLPGGILNGEAGLDFDSPGDDP